MMGDYNDDDIVFVGTVKVEPRDSGYWEKEYGCDEDYFNIEEDNEPWPCNPFLDEYREEINKTRKHKLLGVNNRMSMLINQICALVEEGVDPSLYEEYSLDEIGEAKVVHGSGHSDASLRNHKDDTSKWSQKDENKDIHAKQKDVISSTQWCQTVHQLGDQLSELGKNQCIQESEACETTMEQILEKALPCSGDATKNVGQKDLPSDAVGRADNFNALEEFRMIRKVPVVELVRISDSFIDRMTSISTKNLQLMEDSSIKVQGSTKEGVQVSGTKDQPKISDKDRRNSLWSGCKNKLVAVPSDREVSRSKTSKSLLGELPTKLQAETSAERIEQSRNSSKFKVCLGSKSVGMSTCDESMDQRELVPEKTLLQASLEASKSFKTTSSLQTSLAASLSTFKGTMHQRKSYRVPKCSVETTLSETVNARVKSHKSSSRGHVPYNGEIFSRQKHVTSEHNSLANSSWKLKRKINWGNDSSPPREKWTHSSSTEFAVQEKTEASHQKSLLTCGKKKSKIKW